MHMFEFLPLYEPVIRSVHDEQTAEFQLLERCGAFSEDAPASHKHRSKLTRFVHRSLDWFSGKAPTPTATTIHSVHSVHSVQDR